MTRTPLSFLEQAKLELAHAHYYYYRNFLKYGPNLFEDNGDIVLQRKDGSKSRMNGRELILQTLNYFESKDHSYFYLMCGKLKKVLDDYDAKYHM